MMMMNSTVLGEPGPTLVRPLLGSFRLYRGHRGRPATRLGCPGTQCLRELRRLLRSPTIGRRLRCDVRVGPPRADAVAGGAAYSIAGPKFVQLLATIWYLDHTGETGGDRACTKILYKTTYIRLSM